MWGRILSSMVALVVSLILHLHLNIILLHLYRYELHGKLGLVMQEENVW